MYSAEKAEHGIPAQAVEVGRIGPFPITNSMVVTWVVALVLDHFCATCHAEHEGSPERRAEFLGMAGGKSLHISWKGIIGHDAGEKDVLVFCDHFHFHSVFQLAWVDSGLRNDRVGGSRADMGFMCPNPWFRGANADLNMTLAMSLVFFRVLDCLGLADEWTGWISPASVRAERRDDRRC